MSLVQKVFNLQTLKLVGALAIPSGLIWLFIHSQNAANKAVQEYNEDKVKNPSAENVTINNYQLKEVDDGNHIRWHLSAKTGTVGTSNHDVSLTDVNVEYYDGPNIKMRLAAPIGDANENTKQVVLSGAQGRPVIAEGGLDGKAHLEAAKVELTKKNQFLATGDVNIFLPGVAKVHGDQAEGSTDLSSVKDLKIRGNTRTQILSNSDATQPENALPAMPVATSTDKTPPQATQTAQTPTAAPSR